MTTTIPHFITQRFEKQCEEFIEEESIADANNVTADTFSHTSNTQREDFNATFTSDNLDKSDKLVFLFLAERGCANFIRDI